mgnify:CR=1 FL=1
MEMRKFIIELHGDGSMTWVEYEDQKENPVEKIIKAIEQRKETLQNRARYAAGCEDIESMRENQNAAVEDWLILQLIKHTIRHG